MKMMKRKLLCAVISSAMVLTSMVSTAFAKPAVDGQSAGAQEKVTQIKAQIQTLKSEIDVLREELKALKEDSANYKADRQALMGKIVNLRKNNGEKDIPIFANGKEVEYTDASPVIKYGRILIPMRAVNNALDAETEWDQEDKQVTVTKTVYNEVYADGKEITIIIDLDDKWITVDGVEKTTDVFPELMNNRTYVPIRFLAETLMNKVNWNDEDKYATIDDDEDVDDEDEDEGKDIDEEADEMTAKANKMLAKLDKVIEAAEENDVDFDDEAANLLIGKINAAVENLDKATSDADIEKYIDELDELIDDADEMKDAIEEDVEDAEEAAEEAEDAEDEEEVEDEEEDD